MNIDSKFISFEDFTKIDEISINEPVFAILQDEYYNLKLVDVFQKIKNINLINKIFVFTSSQHKNIPEKIQKDEKFIEVDIKNFKEIINHENLNTNNPNKNISEISTKKKVLFVDDNKTLHVIFKNIFSETNYSLIHAYDGQEGYNLYKKFKPDIIVIDVEMPEINGFELCRAIKEEIQSEYIPVIILSQKDKEIDINAAFDAGADDYLVKPVEPEVLLQKIDEYLSQAEKRSSYKILIVDDSKLVIEVVSNALIKNNLNVITTDNGEDGLLIAKKEIPDIIITDIEMPKMDGYELCKRIKEVQELENTSIIMMSSRNKLSDIKRGEKLGITHYITKPFDSEKMVILVNRILLEKNNLLKKETEDMLSSIKSLVTALEARDIYTKGHTERVSEYSIRFGKYINLSKYELSELEIGSNLHDIGKIGVRDDILLKTEKLTNDEFEKIKEHSQIGATILTPIKSLSHVIPLVLHHHERWDGSGYPSKLKGEEIPLGAQIIAIADAFDAITSDRPYRKGLSVKEGLEIIEKNLGTQFNPELGEKFIEMIKNEKK